MNIKIIPQKLHGEIEAITSKSAAHRALICAYLCDEKSEIKIESTSKDIEATRACLLAMSEKNAVINCGESGSTFRFLLPIAAFISSQNNIIKFIGEGRLPERPISQLIEALRKNGVNISANKLPFTVSGELRSGEFILPGNVSSQFVSGLLFALPLLKNESVIKLISPLESKAYVDMTIDMLKKFGIEIIENVDSYEIKGNQFYKSPGVIDVEKDWSNAAFYLSANALGADIKVMGLDEKSAQGDKEIVSILKRFKENGELSGIEIDVSEVPDLLPILAVVGAFAKGKTKLYNAARLRLKESDRLSAVREMLKNLGAQVEEKSDSLIVSGGTLKGGIVDSKNDHRIVMSAAIAACFCENETIIKGAQAVEKSYPGFFEDFTKLGGKYNVI